MKQLVEAAGELVADGYNVLLDKRGPVSVFDIWRTDDGSEPEIERMRRER